MDMGIDNIQIQFLGGGYRKELPQPEEVLLWHQIAAREFWLDENEITWDNTAWLMQYIMYLNEHEADDMTPIKLHIMCPGGHLYVMFALYDVIKNSKIPVYTYNEGICHSAALCVPMLCSVLTKALLCRAAHIVRARRQWRNMTLKSLV